VIFIGDVDIKGSIPVMIKNTLSCWQGGAPSKIADLMKKDGY